MHNNDDIDNITKKMLIYMHLILFLAKSYCIFDNFILTVNLLNA